MALLPLLAVGLSYVFEPNKKITAFVLGASILSLGFNFTPITQYDQLKNFPNSAKVTFSISEENGQVVKNITVTAIAVSDNSVRRTRFDKSENVFFYLEAGVYNIEITAPGYGRILDKIEVVNQTEIQRKYVMKKSLLPINVQRIFGTY